MIFRNRGSGFSQLFNSEIRLNTSFYCEMIGRVSGPGRLTLAKTFQESFEYKKTGVTLDFRTQPLTDAVRGEL
jgi:hypothetical protein